MKKLLLTALAFISLSLSVAAQATTDDITLERGYVEFTSLEADYGEPKVMINLNKTMLTFVSKLNASDPETSELISKLKAVRVNVYDIEGSVQPAMDLITKVSNDIAGKNWMPIVSVNEEKERVRIFTKVTDDVMDGLVVMVVDDSAGAEREAVFINIVGEIDPEQLNKVTGSLNINVDL
ncbi:DUF4252 domain-containing protein [Alteromonas sediminis]|uniref:DUF4252 domain-containing protein n=1 Tax=Alteromonas sediminis TaxID=2259342 RepID=A0A3N5ZAH4_9ALTE|nr:DUF4252 domain-containing protein [Alteromonas sediminis]RPJ66458.1 DUF4252 domain-containing protein [Alteromonas sediminis]